MTEPTHDPFAEGAMPAAARVPEREVVRSGPSGGSVAARIILTIVGAGGMILGAFLPWIKASFKQGARAINVRGTHLSGKVFFSEKFRAGHFLKSVGIVLIVLGLVALVGMAFRSGWLTRIAAVLGGAAFVLFAIEVVRSKQIHVSNIGIGAWISVAGSVLALVGGFFGTRSRTVVRERA
jgi:hypothetical protein